MRRLKNIFEKEQWMKNSRKAACILSASLCMVVAAMMALSAGKAEEPAGRPASIAIIGETLAEQEKEKAVFPQKEPKTEKEGKNPQTRIFTLYDVPLDDEFQMWLGVLCESRNLDYATMVAMAEQESGFDPDAVGSGGELGMWQIMPETALEVEEALGRKLDLMDPYDNADCAAWLMEKYIKKYGNDIYALFAYSMGERRASECLAGSRPRSLYAVSVLEKAAGYVPRRDGEADAGG